MSKLKVGDRVRFVAMSPDDFETMSNRLEKIAFVVSVHKFGPYPIRVKFDDGLEEQMGAFQLRRLVKRKRPKPAAPDRVMVAAVLMEHVRHYYPTLDRIETIRKALEIADALIAEGAK